jgi:hypothetical protein
LHCETSTALTSTYSVLLTCTQTTHSAVVDGADDAFAATTSTTIAVDATSTAADTAAITEHSTEMVRALDLV